MLTKTIKLFIGIFFVSCLYCDLDNESWIGFELNKNFTSKLDLEVSQNIRTNRENSSIHIYKTFTSIGLTYKVSDIIQLSSKYRYAFEFTPQDGYNSHRFDLDAKIDFEKIKNIRFFPSYRFRIQQKFDEKGNTQDLTIRNRFKHEYSLKNQFTPFTLFEFFHVFDNESLIYDKYRLGCGVEFEANENQAVIFTYLYESNLYYLESLSNYPLSYSTKIFSLKYKYSF
tara:strand:- start:50 stop:730 length:681 start_codon:yes stop_codon:yes gene_type:complete